MPSDELYSLLVRKLTHESWCQWRIDGCMCIAGDTLRVVISQLLGNPAYRDMLDLDALAGAQA